MKSAKVKYQIGSRTDTITILIDAADTDEMILTKAIQQLESQVGGEIPPELIKLTIIDRSL